MPWAIVEAVLRMESRRGSVSELIGSFEAVGSTIAGDIKGYRLSKGRACYNGLKACSWVEE